MCRLTYYHDGVGSVFTGYVVKSAKVSVKLLDLSRSSLSNLAELSRLSC